MKTAIPFVLALCALVALPVAGQDEPAEPEWKGEATPENLKALFEALQAAGDADPKRAARLTLGLIPTKEDYDAVLAPDVTEEQRKQLAAIFASITPDTPLDELARLLVPGGGRTEVVVHGATVAEVRAMEKGTVAERVFPGGAQRVAYEETDQALDRIANAPDAGAPWHHPGVKQEVRRVPLESFPRSLY